DRSLRDLAIREARQALAIDARSTIALAALAATQLQHVLFQTAADVRAAWHEGVTAATQAIEADRSDGSGYVWRGLLLFYSPEADFTDEALANLRHALELNPNDALAMNFLGYAEMAAGNPAQGMQHLHRALRTSPGDPLQRTVYNDLAQAYFLEKDYAKAIEYGALGTSGAPDFPILYMTLAVAHVGSGNLAKAKALMETARRLAPEFIQSRLNGGIPYRKAEHRQRFTTFLRIAAGLEDPSAAEAFR
ncbi:MAG: tetratricopeptide repeat protein, partial [Terriglobales bacterium]